MTQNEIKKYFETRSRNGKYKPIYVFFCVLSLIALYIWVDASLHNDVDLSGFSDAWTISAFILLAIPLVVFGRLLIIPHRSKLSDSDVDAIYAEKAKSVLVTAKSKLQFDEAEAEQMHKIILGATFNMTDGQGKTKSHSDWYRNKYNDGSVCFHRKGADSIWRSSLYHIICLFVDKKRIYCYTHTFSLLSDFETCSFGEYNLSQYRSVAVENFEQFASIPLQKTLSFKSLNQNEYVPGFSLCYNKVFDQTEFDETIAYLQRQFRNSD